MFLYNNHWHIDDLFKIFFIETNLTRIKYFYKNNLKKIIYI